MRSGGSSDQTGDHKEHVSGLHSLVGGWGGDKGGTATAASLPVATDIHPGSRELTCRRGPALVVALLHVVHRPGQEPGGGQAWGGRSWTPRPACPLPPSSSLGQPKSTGLISP
jgi:hypothetical protein